MEKRDKITRICVWSVVSTLSILSGLFLFIWLLRLYISNKANTPIYTRENVGVALLQICAILIFFVLGVIVAGVLSYFKKLDDEKPVKSSSQMKLEAILSHISGVDKENTFYLSLQKEKNKRIIQWSVAFILELIAALFIFLYLGNAKNFPLDGEPLEVFKKLAIHTLPFLFIIGVIHFIGVFLEDMSFKKSIEDAKCILKEYKNKDERKVNKKNTYILWGIRGAILFLGMVLVIIGLAGKGYDFVLRNAITICSACIGLG